MRRTVFLAILFSKLFVATGQDLGALGPSRIIGPSPEPSRIARYGSYDVSYYTGKPQISIPVYNIKTPDLEVPVNLTYEANGIRLDELPSWTGTGWMLSAGGMITRVIVGNPDEFSYGYLSQTIPYGGTADLDYLYKVAYLRMYETEPDKYYFNFNGRSGEFTFDVSKNIWQVPVTGLKITPIGGGFQIVDEQGNTYEFSTAERSQGLVNGDAEYQPFAPTTWWLTKITSANKSDLIDFSYTTDNDEQEDRPTYSAAYGPKYYNGQSGGYAGPPELDLLNPVMTKSWYPVRLSSIVFNNGKLVFNKVSGDRLDGGRSRLESIDIYNQANGAYNKMRSVKLIPDYFHYSGPYSNTLIFYSNTVGRYRLKLNRLEDYDQNGTLISKHQFEYNNETELPFRGSCQQDYWGYFNGAEVNDQKRTLLPEQYTDDYNYVVGGANRNPNEQFMKAGMLTKVIYPTGGYSVFNWEAHKYLYSGQSIESHVSYCSAQGNNSYNDPHPYQTLTFTLPAADRVKIIADIPAFPSTVPQYDNPAYRDSAEITRPNIAIYNVATGQRLFYVVNSTPTFTYYDLSPLDLPAGTYMLVSECFVNSVNAKANITVEWHTTTNIADIRLAGGLRIADIQHYNYDNSLAYKESYRYGQNESGYGNLSLPPNYLNTLAYNKIYKWYYSYQVAAGTQTYYGIGVTTRKVYRSEPVASLNLASGSAVVYPVVTRYVGDNQNNAGKTIYHYQDVPDMDIHALPSGQTGEYLVRKLGWVNPRIQQEEVFSKKGNGYTLVKDTYNDYTTFGFNTFPVMKIGLRYENIMMDWLNLDATDYYQEGYDIGTAVEQLTATRIKEYDLSGNLSLETVKTYDYDNTYHAFPAAETFTNSKGETVKTESKYPFDKNQLTGLNTVNSQAIDRMIAKNIIAPTIEKQVSRNTSLMERQRTNYRIWDGPQNIVMPENIQLQIKNNPTEQRMFFESYDENGNLLQQSKANDVKQSYIWDYASTYPVAEVKGATGQQIAYTSFESDGSGNWNIGNSARATAGITGAKSYDLTNGSISKSDLDAGTTYIISYWTTSASPLSIAGTQGPVLQGKKIGNWTYFEHKVSGVTQVSIAGSILIDELRLYPADAQMTTYTYTPLIGITSACSANNAVIYYEYDPFQRLKLTRDQDGNIVKTFKYNYKQ
jgi:hypothetical protein